MYYLKMSPPHDFFRGTLASIKWARGRRKKSRQWQLTNEVLSKLELYNLTSFRLRHTNTHQPLDCLFFLYKVVFTSTEIP
jgi:hypothetical protein